MKTKQTNLTAMILMLVAICLCQGCKDTTNQDTDIKSLAIDTVQTVDAMQELENIVGGKERLDRYVEFQRQQEIQRGVALENQWGILTTPLDYAASKVRAEKYLRSAKHHPADTNDIEKSVYHGRSQLEAKVNAIVNSPGSQYTVPENFGYRIYFAKYLDDDPKTPHDGKYTAIIRLTYEKEDIPFSDDYDVALNLGNLCPPDCLGTTRPGQTGRFSQ